MANPTGDGRKSEAPGKNAGGKPHERNMYLRFGAMIATSTFVMFVLTYTNSFAWSHVSYSEERVYMALLMGAAMAIVMLAFM